MRQMEDALLAASAPRILRITALAGAVAGARVHCAASPYAWRAFWSWT